MAVPTDLVARTYLNVQAGVPIMVPIPTFEISDVYVYYGLHSLEADYAVDYTVILEPDYAGFTLTPTQALIDKINALIVADPDETNYITVRRSLDMLTDASAANMRNTTYAAKEIDRAAMRDQQLTERLNRTLALGDRFAGEQPLLTIDEAVPGAVLMFDDEGTSIVAGPTADEIENAQLYAERAEAAAEEALQAANLSSASLSALLADTRPWPQGAVIQTRNDGKSYEVAAPSATDQHYTTAGGVKLYEAGPFFSSRERFAQAVQRGMTDGAEVIVQGQPYVVDSTATGYDSALQDLGVDGVRRADRLENLILAAHFTTQDDTTIHISASLDGVHFSVINSAVLPGGQGFDLSQRDPSITYFAGWWWIFGTGGSAGNHDFVCFRSRDLPNWSKFQIVMAGGPYFSDTTPMPGGVSPASAIWAPEPFIENGTMHVMISIRFGADFTNIYGATQQHFRPYVTTLTDPETLAFSAPVPMIFGPGDHTDGDSRIDPSVVKHNGVYYCAIKDSYYRRIQMYHADDLTGPYTFDQVLSGGTLEIEAPCLVRIRDRSAINSETRRDKWRVYVDNNRTGVGDPDPNSLVGAPYYFEAVGAPDATYGAMQKCYFDTPVRHGSIVNLSELPPEASRALSNVAAAGGQKRLNLGRQVELGSGSQWIRPQQDTLYYASINSGAVALQLRDGPADRFYLGVMSAQGGVGILVQGSGFSPRQFILGFGRGNDAVIEMRRRVDGQYYPVGLVRRSEFRAHRNGSNQSITAGTDTAVVWTTEAYDAGDNFDTGTGRWTPPRGRIDIEAQVTITDGESSGTLRVDILKNGSAIVATGYAQGSGQFAARAVLHGGEANGTDYYSAQVRATGAGSRTLNGNAYLTNFYGIAW